MVIGNLHIESVSILPAKADSILIVDTHAVLPEPVSFQHFEVVRRRRGQVSKLFRAIDLNQSPQSDSGDLLECPDPLLVKDRFSIAIAEGSNQATIILRPPFYEQRWASTLMPAHTRGPPPAYTRSPTRGLSRRTPAAPVRTRPHAPARRTPAPTVRRRSARSRAVPARAGG